MYMSEKHPSPSRTAAPPPPAMDYQGRLDMIIEVSNTHLPSHHNHHHHSTADNSAVTVAATCGGGENSNNSSNPSSSELKAPKKRAETWVKEETRALINFRREIDSLFNTSKSNKHLWDQISMKMRERGFDRSPTMCTDKWRNLLKEFKKAAKRDQDRNGIEKMMCFKEIEEIMKDRVKDTNGSSNYKRSPPTSKVDSFIQFSDKGLDDTSISFGPEGNGRTSVDHEGHTLAIAAVEAVAASGASPPWNWRETPGTGEQSNSFEGRVIIVKCGEYTKRIGIDGTPKAIISAIKAAFRLRTKRSFWLEDEDNIVRTIDRDMPLGNYTLHVDEGLTIKVCLYDEADNLAVHTEDKTFYNDDEFYRFLTGRGWSCLREYNGYRNVDKVDELCHGAIYRGIIITSSPVLRN